MLGKLIFKFHTLKLINTPALSPKGLFLFAEIRSNFKLNCLAMFKGINVIEFGKRFYDNESCYLYLIEQK